MVVGDSIVIGCNGAKRAAIGNADVADVVALSSRELLLNAKSPGRTVLYVWDKSGKCTYNVTVTAVDPDMADLCARIAQEINDDRISVRNAGYTVMLGGRVSSEAESLRAESIARSVAEQSSFKGVYSQPRSQETKSVSRPEGDSFVVERNTLSRDTGVAAESGLRCPKVMNFIQIQQPMGEVSVRTLEIAAAVRSALNNQTLNVRPLAGSVVLIEGRVGTEAEIAYINQVIKGWEKRGTDEKGMPEGATGNVERITIVNSVVLDSSIARQVLVRAQVIDINRNDIKDIGVDWGSVIFDSNGNPTVEQPFIIGELTPQPNLFDVGRIQRLQPIGARIQALITQNRARVLSEPNLLVLDGREASMLVGGEIPIPVVQTAQIGVASSVTIEYKEFGVRLKMIPVITGADRLQLRIMPEVSSLDFANAVVLSGFVIPALNTRRTETTVNIGDAQSLIIGGLINRTTSEVIRKIPLLGDIPIIGELFKSRHNVVGETELVVVITPYIVRPGATPPIPSGLPQVPPAQTAPAAPVPTGTGR
jgi:pilus assembly protein CpaC